MMKLEPRHALPWLLIFLGLLAAAVFFLQPVTLVVDGTPSQVRGLYLDVGSAVRAAGLALDPADRVVPGLAELIPASGRIEIRRAHSVGLWIDGAVASFATAERIPANWMAQAGYSLFPGDRVYLNGRPADPLDPVAGPGPFALQIIPARALRLVEDGRETVLYTGAATVGAALWERGLQPRHGDRLSTALNAPVDPERPVELRRAREITILAGGRETAVQTAALTVGEALREAGLAPQGLDYSQPPEYEALPPNGRIRVVRVREVVALAEELLPFQNSYAPSDQLELDQREVIQPGRYGVVLNRERVRYEDGVETARIREGQWTAAQPQDQVIGVGTRAVVKSIDTEYGTLEYYRAVNVYATAYSPCQQGLGRCSRATSSGTPLQKGVVAVRLSWYRLFAGARLYIPGYGIGVIADVGGGIPGQYWIDLGYSDEDYQSWSQNVTVYFLTPIPPNVPAVLP